MATFGTHVETISGKYCSFTIRKLDVNNLQTQYWHFNLFEFVDTQPPFAQDHRGMVEESSSGFYEGFVPAELETYTGNIVIKKFRRENVGFPVSSAVIVENETVYVRAGVWGGNPVALSTFRGVSVDKTWQAVVGTTSKQIVKSDSAYDDWYAMDFSTTLNAFGKVLDENVPSTVVDQSGNVLSTNTIRVSADRLKVFFKTGSLTVNRTYEFKVTGTTTGPAIALISTGILRT